MFRALRPLVYGWTRQVGFRLHLAGAFLWILAPVLVVALGDRRALRVAAGELLRLRRGDGPWLLGFPRWVLGGRANGPDVGRFNAGQKLYAAFTLVASALLLFTGLGLFPRGDGAAVLGDLLAGPGSVRRWRVAHGLLALSLLPPLLGHLWFALVHPRTRPALGGMILGMVDAGWAAAEHARWYAEITKGLETVEAAGAAAPQHPGNFLLTRTFHM